MGASSLRERSWGENRMGPYLRRRRRASPLSTFEEERERRWGKFGNYRPPPDEVAPPHPRQPIVLDSAANLLIEGEASPLRTTRSAPFSESLDGR